MLDIVQTQKMKRDPIIFWYLIQTKPNAHQIASYNLKQQGFDVFLPFVIKTTKKGTKFVNNKIPLFPNYLFMGTQLKHIPWKSINATRGVTKAVTLDGTYRTVSVELIKGLKSRCDSNGIIKAESAISSGDKVRIERGPLTEFICKVEKHIDKKEFGF